MDGELGAMLESVLNDPRQMEKIAAMARGLMGDATPDKTEPAQGKNDGVEGAFASLGNILSGREEKSRSAALLMAMRPYMRPEKQEKLDRAMKITRMVHIAGAVMGQYGGGGTGL